MSYKLKNIVVFLRVLSDFNIYIYIYLYIFCPCSLIVLAIHTALGLSSKGLYLEGYFGFVYWGLIFGELVFGILWYILTGSTLLTENIFSELPHIYKQLYLFIFYLFVRQSLCC